ncbi:MAG TPA: hypothetical protein PKC49_07655 [Phycisphaerae bacterium]|nr:hypothetical protein [Phycisphaerae bacterium]
MQAPIRAGQKVRIIQEIDRREGAWTNEVVGTVVEFRAQKTGSWYAHGKDDKLWLNRVRLRKADGEITTIAVDQFTRVEILEDAPVAS